MILVIFSAAALSIIPEKFTKIANLAKKRSHLLVKDYLEEEIILPGKYKDGLISFDVKKPFTSTNYQEIKGFAIDYEIEAIAIVSNNDFKDKVKGGASLSDVETASLFQIVEELGYDDDVTIYKIHQTNIFSILSNIKIVYDSSRYSSTILDGDVRGVCEKDEQKCNLFSEVGYSKKYNYDEIQNEHPEYITYTTPLQDSKGNNYTFDVKLGGYTSSSVSYELCFESIQEFKANIKTIGKCTFEAGFRFPKSTIELNDIDISSSDLYKKNEMKKSITQFNYSKYGFNLSVDLYYLYDLHLYLRSLHISNDIEINATAVFDFNKKYLYTTTDNEKITSNMKSFDFDIDSNAKDNANNDDFTFNFVPAYRNNLLFDINITFFGVLIASTNIQVGIENRYDTEMKFDNTYNSYCQFPYISYSYVPQYCPVFEISKPVKLFNFNIINEKHYVFSPIWSGDRIGPRCFYGIQNPNPKIPIESPVLLAKEISNLQSNQINLELLVGEKKIIDLDLNEDKTLNIVKNIDSNNNNLSFKGHKLDQNFMKSLLLKFYPNNFEIYSYLQDRITTITDFYNVDAKFIFNFYQGIELNPINETINTELSRFAYFETSENVALIQHSNGKNYFVCKTKIYDDQLSYEENYIYHKKNNWKLSIDLHNIEIKVKIHLVNSNTLVTEQSFDYTDDCVILVENRKLYLQFEFKNKETKVIDVNIDFTQKKKKSISEELYHNTKIDIILEPYSSIAFFDLDELSCSNETGFFPSYVLEEKDIYSFKNEKGITTKYNKHLQDTKYLVYHFKTDLTEDDINETLYIVLVSQGFYPLSAIEEFPNEMYLVEFKEFTFEDGFLVFYIPLARNRDYTNGDEIQIKAIFAQPLQNQAFCPNSYHYTNFISTIPIGCIDRNFDYDSILSITSYDSNGNQYDPIKITPHVSTNIFINIFNHFVDSNCILARIPTTFSENSLTLSISDFLASALISYNVHYLKIKCERCSGIFRNKKTYNLDDNNDIYIELDAEINSDYYAVCLNNNNKNCIIKLDLNPNKVTLIKNPMVAVITVLNYLEDYPQISIPKTQLFSSYGQSTIIYSKNNIAGLDIESELDPTIDLTLKAEVKGRYIRLYSITNNNIYFPFDPLSMFSSLEDALKQLGLESGNFQLYNIRDEIFINDINAIKNNPQNPSPELLFGLPSRVITSINFDYNIESFQTQEADYLCYCFVNSASQECKEIEIYGQKCSNFIKLTEHEYNNFDVYLPERAEGYFVIFMLCTDVIDYHPSLETLPEDAWKIAIFSNNNNEIRKFTGSLYIFPGQKVDCYNTIDCSELDVTIEVDVTQRKIGVFDASSSNSDVSIHFVITNELQNKVENYCLYSPDREALLNVHKLKSYTMNTNNKQVSTTGKYIYSLIDNNNNKDDDTKGHYYLSIIYQENDVHLNEDFCVEEDIMSDCEKDQIPIRPRSLIALHKYIKSYSDKMNYITLHFAKLKTYKILPDCFFDLSTNHYNIHISMESKDPFDLCESLILYHNLNVSFGDKLNLENTILKQQVKIGIKQNISLNNKIIQKVEVSIICPEKEIEFDSIQILIYGYDSRNQGLLVDGNTCQLDHSSITFTLNADDNNLVLNVEQNFNSYGNNICLFSDSVDKCEDEYGLPLKIDGFTADKISSQDHVTITLVDDFECNLNLLSKKITFKGNAKISGTLELSSDSNIEIQGLDISELKILLKLDVEKEEVSYINLQNNEMLPSSIHCILLNPNSKQLTLKFADLNVIDGINLKWISEESYYESNILSTELVIEDKSASVKVNLITAKKVLCYYETDSNNCPPETTRQSTEMWKDFNESIIFIAEDINSNNVNFNNHVVYITGSGKINGNAYFYGSSIVHFLEKQLVENLNIYTFADFGTRKAPKIVFGKYESKPQNWNLKVQGYDITCSFTMFENGQLTLNELENDQDTNLVIEKIGTSTIIHFTEHYQPNSFCIYNYPYESYCYSNYPLYKPINSKDLWNIKLQSNNEPNFIFASTLSTFLPLQRFKNEKFSIVSIEVLEFATCPKFLVPEDFTLKINGDSSHITAKVSVNTNSLEHGNLLYNDEIGGIELVPVNEEVFYDDDTIIIMGQSKYVDIKPLEQYNNDYQMHEIYIEKKTNDYDFTSDMIDELYSLVSNDIIVLKLTSDLILDVSKLNVEKLAIYGANHNLKIIHDSTPTLKLLIIDSADINFDSLLDLRVGVFNSNININPFATDEILSSDLSYKYNNQVFPIDGSTITITENTLIVNNKNIQFDKRNLNLYVNDFCSIQDSSTKTINVYGIDSSVDIKKSDQSLITFNKFNYLIVNSNNIFNNIHFNDNFVVDFNSPEKAQIDFYNLESSYGYLVSPTTHSSIKQMNLFGKPFYSDNTDVSSLSVFNNKALMKGVVLADSLQIDQGASLIAHSSSFQSTVSSHFRLTSATPLLVLVDSTFDCSNISIDIEYAYQHKQYTLIKGLQNLESCEKIKTKVSASKKKKRYDLICYENPNDDLIDLIVTNIQNQKTKNKLSTGEIVAIVLPICCGIIIFIVILSIFINKRRNQNGDENQSENENQEENENQSENEDTDTREQDINNVDI